MIGPIDHIAIAVEDLDEAVQLYEKTFGLKPAHREYIESFQVEIATIDLPETTVELIEARSPDSPIHKFIETRGPGLHHIAFVVDDIEGALAKLKAKGLALIDETPRRGKDDSLVAFVHPGGTQRVLYELVQLRK